MGLTLPCAFAYSNNIESTYNLIALDMYLLFCFKGGWGIFFGGLC